MQKVITIKLFLSPLYYHNSNIFPSYT